MSRLATQFRSLLNFISGEDGLMSLQFNLAYFFGYAPWDRWGGKPLRQLRELLEGPQAIAPGRVLDLGCGMGRATIYLAQLGWKATGIDAVGRALRVARRRAATAGIEVEFVEGDITQLDRAGIVGPFDLFLDLGCFHILSDQERRRYGESIARAATANARLILFAFGHNKHFLGPRGAERDDIERSLAPDWTIVWSTPEKELPYRTPRGASATWYMLQRVSQPRAG
jgi:SAM-dependent methyltransferase